MLKLYLCFLCFLILSGCGTTKDIKTRDITFDSSGAAANVQVKSKEDITTVPAVEKPKAGTAKIAGLITKIEPVAVTKPITYSQITNLISEFIDIQVLDGNFKETRYFGASENGLVTLDLIGDKNNISTASMRLIYQEGMEPIEADLNRAMMLRFLRNAAPGIDDWPTRVVNIIEKYRSLENTDKEQEQIASLGDKKIQVLYDKKKSTITVTLE